MRKLLPFLFFCAGCFPSVGAEPSPPKLTGIISLPGYKCALLEYFDPDFKRLDQYAIREGERIGSLEALQINPENGAMRLKVNSRPTNAVLTLDLNATDKESRQTHAAIQLREAALNQVISLYAEFIQRTVLRPPLAEDPLTLNAGATSQVEAASVLARALGDKGLTNILDGNKFVIVLPAERAFMAHPHSDQIKSSPTDPAKSKSKLVPAGIIPAGEIYFPGTDLYQVLSIYAELIGRQLDRSAPFPWFGKKIFLHTQTSLSKEEAIYAFDTVFSWENLKVIPVGTNMARAVEINPK